MSAPVTGLEPGMTYHFLLVATYGVGKTVSGATTQMFTTDAVTAPTATTLAAEGFKETEATLKGTVNPGGEATEYFFEYGTGTGYGQKTEKATLLASGGNQGVSATLKGLTPGTEYHFRLVAKNKQGPAEGLDHSFKTMSPPTKAHRPKNLPRKRPSPYADPYRRQSHGHNLQLTAFWATKDRTCFRPAVWVAQAGIHSARRSGAWISGRVLGRF